MFVSRMVYKILTFALVIFSKFCKENLWVRGIKVLYIRAYKILHGEHFLNEGVGMINILMKLFHSLKYCSDKQSLIILISCMIELLQIPSLFMIRNGEELT